jgi:hypothetical protein
MLPDLGPRVVGIPDSRLGIGSHDAVEKPQVWRGSLMLRLLQKNAVGPLPSAVISPAPKAAGDSGARVRGRTGSHRESMS